MPAMPKFHTRSDWQAGYIYRNMGPKLKPRKTEVKTETSHAFRFCDSVTVAVYQVYTSVHDMSHMTITFDYFCKSCSKTLFLGYMGRMLAWADHALLESGTSALLGAWLQGGICLCTLVHTFVSW